MPLRDRRLKHLCKLINLLIIKLLPAPSTDPSHLYIVCKFFQLLLSYEYQTIYLFLPRSLCFYQTVDSGAASTVGYLSLMFDYLLKSKGLRLAKIKPKVSPSARRNAFRMHFRVFKAK